MRAWVVLAISALYLLLLFVVAWWGDRKGGKRFFAGSPLPAAPAIIYALTLAIYNTSWSFYGSVGRASTSGLAFMTIYLGPVLVLGPGGFLLYRIIQIAKAQNVTSVSDFIAARYGKSGSVAAAVTLVALLATLPYIALQLKAIAGSYDVLIGAAAGSGHPDLPLWRDTAFAVAVTMAVFAILFGVRHVEASERHRGLMLAIAFESLVKLIAFLAVSAAIVFGIADGPREIFARAAAQGVPEVLRPGIDLPAWIVQTIVSAFSFLCLPHTFHVAVVENETPEQVRTARWLFPLYLACLSAAMLPVAMVGLLTFGGGNVNPDNFMIALPLQAGNAPLGMVTFLGGLSAATGMVIVAAVALSTMTCNDVIMPLLMRSPHFSARTLEGGVAPLLLKVRRLGVIGVLLLAYLTYRMTDRDYSLAHIGLMSFVAMAQLGPGLLGALYWRRATAAGVLAGLAAGTGLWVYLLLLPSIGSGGGPQALFGIAWSDPIAHAAFWSLAANCLVLAGVSLLRKQSSLEWSQSRSFALPESEAPAAARPWRVVPALSDLQALAEHYLGRERGRQAFQAHLRARESGGPPVDGSGLADRHAIDFTETLLAGAIGAASARVIIASSVQGRLISRSHAMAMLGEASEAIGSGHRILAGALESIVQGICVFDADLRVVAWNQVFITILELPADLVKVGLPLTEIIRYNTSRGEYSADDLPALIVNQDRDALQWPYVYERERPDGTVLDVVYNRLPGGGCIATFTDVTERHRALAAKAQAEQANAAKTHFLAAVSHDLLQPLTAARLFASALNEALTEGREHQLSVNLLASIRSTEFLLNDLLDISSLDTGAIRAQEQSFAIQDILGELSVEFSALARERGLSFRMMPCSAVIRSDPRLLRRILQNFLSNAVRYTRSGGILVGCRRRGDWLHIAVHDTGPGIAEADQTVIFEEFRRLPGGEPGRERGLGLGLSIVEKAAKLLRHEILLRSVPGRGTCFAVSVPRIAEGSSAAAAPENTAPDLVAGLRVLCIDNEPEILAGLKALMEPWGCRVFTSPADPRPDLLVVDYHLDDGVNGLDLIRQLRSRWQSAIPALLVTADRSESVRQAAAELNCLVLTKPLKPAALRRYLASVALQTEAPS